LVHSNPEDFLELIKKINTGVDQKTIGNRVVGMRQTRAGGLLVEVDSDAERVEIVRAELTKATGDGARMKALAQKGLLEVKDIASWAGEEDVIRALVRVDVPPKETKILNIRKQYDGSLAATVLLPLEKAERIAADGHIKIGMVYCRIKMGVSQPRCHTCLALGHESKACNGTNREKCCRKCGQDGHFTASCGVSEEAVLVFRKLLLDESREGKMTTGPTLEREFQTVPSVSDKEQCDA